MMREHGQSASGKLSYGMPKPRHGSRKTRGERAFAAVNTALLVVISLLMVYPFLYVIFASLSDPIQFARFSGALVRPLGLDTGAYAYVFKNPNILMGYENTLFYLTVGTAMQMAVTILSAYVLSRKGYMLKKALSLFVMFTMFFNGGLIPTYLQVNALGIYDTRWAMILPKLIITFNLVILRTGFEAVPSSLEESARLDGANDFQIMTRIVVPLSLPTVAILVLYYAVGHWNTWFTAMLYLRSRKLYPIQLILREILFISSTSGGASASDLYSETIKYASIIVTTLPILVIYPLIQRYFVKGMMVGAVKG